jgi:hypothetical protein
MRDFPKKRDTKFAPADQASLVLGLQNCRSLKEFVSRRAVSWSMQLEKRLLPQMRDELP